MGKNEGSDLKEGANFVHSSLDCVQEDIPQAGDTTKKDTTEQDVYDVWNPMLVDYFSLDNIYLMDIKLPGLVDLVYGTPSNNFPSKHSKPFAEADKPQVVKFNQNSEVRCPHLQSSNYDDHNKESGEKVMEVPSYFSQLKSQPIILKDRILEVTVEHVNNPGKFYVTCGTALDCGCSGAKKGHSSQMSRKVRLERELTAYLLRGFLHMKSKFWHYKENQLVAVKRNVNNQILFSRAVVLHDTIDVRDLQKPSVHIQLLDNGAKMIVKFADLCNLPANFVTSFEPLAVQCTLHGISPIPDKWASEARIYFKSVIHGKKCLVKIIHSDMLVTGGDPTDFLDRKNLYEVELLILLANPVTEEERYQSLTEILASQFYGVLLSSSSSFRPSLNEVVLRETPSFLPNDIGTLKELDLIRKREKAPKT